MPVPRQAQSWNGLARRKPIARKAWGEKERVRYQSELKWQAQIIELAQVLGWWPFHLYYAQRSPAGWPDLVLLRERVIFAELKGRSKDGKAETLKPLQVEMAHRCFTAGVEYYAWLLPDDFEEIKAVLSEGGKVKAT